MVSMGDIRVRLARTGAVYGAAGLLWWSAIGATRGTVGCGEWGCLYPTLAAYLAITVGVLTAMVPLLRRIGVHPARRVAVRAAVVLMAVRVLAETLPPSSSQVVVLGRTAVAFALAGMVGAFLAAPDVPARWRRLGWCGLLAVPSAAFAVLVMRLGL